MISSSVSPSLAPMGRILSIPIGANLFIEPKSDMRQAVMFLII